MSNKLKLRLEQFTSPDTKQRLGVHRIHDFQTESLRNDCQLDSIGLESRSHRSFFEEIMLNLNKNIRIASCSVAILVFAALVGETLMRAGADSALLQSLRK